MNDTLKVILHVILRIIIIPGTFIAGISFCVCIVFLIGRITGNNVHFAHLLVSLFIFLSSITSVIIIYIFIKQSKNNEKYASQQRANEQRRKQEDQRWHEGQRQQQDQQRRQEEEQRRREEERRRQEQQRTSSQPTESDHHKTLGTKPGMSFAEIKKAYHKKVMEYHPDKVSQLGEKLREVAEQEMKKINEAYNYFERKYQ